MLTINTESQKLFAEDGQEELTDLSVSFTPQRLEFIRAGGSYAIEFGKKLQAFAAATLNFELLSPFAPARELHHKGQGLTAVEKNL